MGLTARGGQWKVENGRASSPELWLHPVSQSERARLHHESCSIIMSKRVSGIYRPVEVAVKRQIKASSQRGSFGRQPS